ncbi:MAG: hypothetical protein JSS08_01230 [Proteobacteria bacterium]|nr:hypothetical protein [Pseudomonadota bacterium]
MSPVQWAVMQSLMDGEEGAYLSEVAATLNRRILEMPVTYQSGQEDGDQATVYLHYFLRGSDVWVLEKDRSGGLSQVFAFVVLNGDYQMAELGYTDLSLLLATGFELDFHFAPRTLAEVKSELRKRFALF